MTPALEPGAQQRSVIAELDDITLTYGTGAAAVRAVRGVSLQVRRGEVLLLMGPSGSGKSSLLQVLGCLRHPTSGGVMIDDTAAHTLDARALSGLRRARIGFVFQHYNLVPALRAWENVALALEIQGTRGRRIEVASRDMLMRLGLVERADAYPGELSGGEKQRVAIARALIGEPDLVLADEPTAALDAASGSQVAQLLAGMARSHGRAVVVVTHDTRISGIADRIALLEDGRMTSVKKNIQLAPRPLREELIA